MKITRSTLRKIIFERLLVEAISVAQAEAKLKNSIPKMINSIEFIIKRDGGAEKIFEKYKNKYNIYDDPDPYDKLSLSLKEGAEESVKQAYAKNLFNYLIGDVISSDMTEAGRSNSILFLIKKMNEDPPLAYFLLRVAWWMRMPMFAVPPFPDKIRNSLELHDQYKHVIMPKEKRDLFRIENLEELISLIAANKPAIDAENERLSRRIGAKNAVDGFKPLTGKLNLSIENKTLVLDKNPQTGFYTIPDANGFVVGEIHTKPASVKLGSGTDWCTAAPGLDYFDDYYSPDDPLYYIEDNGERFQFSYGSEQFQDRDDNPIDEELVKKYSYILRDLLIKRDGSIQNKKLAEYLISILGSDPNMMPEELDELSRHKNPIVKRNVAFNKKTSKKTLHMLANDDDLETRMSVASNKNTPRNTLEKLSFDQDMNVKYSVAGNPSTASKVLVRLYEEIVPGDPVSEGIVHEIAGNPVSPPDLLRKIFTKLGPKSTASIRFASNPATPIDVLLQIYMKSDSWIKEAISKHPTYIEYLKSQNLIQERWLRIARLLN